jgi:hypothetical protein
LPVIDARDADPHPVGCTVTNPAPEGTAVWGADQGAPDAGAGTTMTAWPSLRSVAVNEKLRVLPADPAVADAGETATVIDDLASAHTGSGDASREHRAIRDT